MPIVRYGFGSKQYTFPQDTLQDFQTNFADLVPRTERLPGLSGGYDAYGTGIAPTEIGKVSLRFYLVADSREEMTAKRDAVRAMAGWGVQRLWLKPTDPALTERWCYARVTNISMPERHHEYSDLHQPVSIIWQASDPRWFTQGTEAWSWGDGTAWSQAPWGGSATPQACSGTQTTFTITTNGNTLTEPRITIKCGAGQTGENPTVQRLVNGVVVDEVKYAGMLAAGDELLIDCRALRVLKNGASAYSTAFTFLHPAWFRLEPGANSIRVLLANSGDAASVTLRYFEAYR